MSIERYYTKLINAVLDDLWGTLPNPAQSVYIQLYRLSYGHARRTCKIGLPRLAERCNLGLTAARGALRHLQKLGLIERLSVDLEGAERGVEWRVHLPGSTPSDAVAPSGNKGASRGKGASPGAPMKRERHEESAPSPEAILGYARAALHEYRHRHPDATEADLRAHLEAWAEEAGHPADVVLRALA